MRNWFVIEITKLRQVAKTPFEINHNQSRRERHIAVQGLTFSEIKWNIKQQISSPANVRPLLPW